ncbi:DUF3488 and transglutaminase-like domain-containing protein [Neomicrococcus lactis]|uniref:DUF3488 and transglutaminase-like domain-containing protein n=1 Tax=Neomicrococcus lactis TaxID=732241 RepID=UPI002300FB3A|nr:DUF3488 and transglutaminase-like domain-containing protein [Neomicrococcus lactis]
MTTTVPIETPPEAAEKRPRRAASSSFVPRLLAQNLAVFLATCAVMIAAATSLEGMYSGWSWMWDIGVVVVVVAGAITGTRTIGSLVSKASWLDQEPSNPRANVWVRSFTPSLAGLLALIGFTIARFMPETALLKIFPTTLTLDTFQGMVRFASEEVMSQVTPVIPSSALIALTCLAVGLLVILFDLLAFGVGFPAISGMIPASMLVVTSLVEPRGAGMMSIAATAVGYMLVLAVAQWVATSRVQGARLPQFVTVVAAGLAALLLVPAAIPGFSSGFLPEGKRLYLFGEPTGVNPVLNLGANLSQPLALDSIYYYTNSEKPVYLRTAVVSDLADSRWAPSDIDEERLALDPGGTFLPQQRVSRSEEPSESGDTKIVEIHTGNYNSPWLPIPQNASNISGISNAWGWNPTTSTIFTRENAQSSDLNYQVATKTPAMDANEMSSIVQSERLENYVLERRFPDETQSSDSAVVRSTFETALSEAKISADTADKFSVAVALQNFLRSTRFTYSEQTPLEQGYDGNGLSVVEEFLRVGAGYCIHYSSAMALMAREAGIPSRIVVGYSPGRSTGNSVNRNGIEAREYAVSARNAHAWPELYFEGLGWIPFEPTPGRGTTPDYAPEASAAAASTSTSESVLTQSVPTTESVASSTVSEVPPVDAAPGTGSSGLVHQPAFRVVLAALGALLVVALLLLIPFFIRSSRRSRSARILNDPNTDASERALTAWRELTDTAKDFGYPMRREESAAAFTQRLGVALQADGEPSSSSRPYDAAAPLQRLRTAFEVARYARSGSVLDDFDASKDIDSLKSVFMDRADSRTRFRAKFWPPSVLGAFRKH